MADLFRAYDVRGRVGDDLDEDIMHRIGQAAATWFHRELGQDAVLLGRDARTSSPALADAFARGAAAAGADVTRVGLVPYGVALHASRDRQVPSAYITASHLAPDWNGVKFADPSGAGLVAEENAAIDDLFQRGVSASGDGAVHEADVLDAYRTALVGSVDLAPVSVAVDCGNGAASIAAPRILQEAGADTTPLFAEPDGTFPNRDSDVTAETLTALQDAVVDRKLDCGVGFDGDADRVAVVDDTGRLLSAEQAAAVVLQHILPDASGPVIANVECSRLLEDIAGRSDRTVARVRVGHSYMVRALQEQQGCLAVETSRHMSLPHISPVDDALAAALGIVEAVSRLDRPLSAAVDALPTYHRDRTAFAVPDEDKFAVVEALQDAFTTEFDRVDTTDGVRVDLDDGWVLVRASNTSPKVRLTVEAATPDARDRLRDRFSARIEDAVEAHT